MSLFFVAMAHALVVAVTISAGFRISGGHLNPAVTLGLCMGGHITVFRSILYWIDQLLASVAACALLNYLTAGLVSNPTTTFSARTKITNILSSNLLVLVLDTTQTDYLLVAYRQTGYRGIKSFSAHLTQAR